MLVRKLVRDRKQRKKQSGLVFPSRFLKTLLLLLPRCRISVPELSTALQG